MNRKHFLVFVAVGLLGCERVHSNYCEGAPNHNCKDMVDAPIDAAACSSNASCSAPLGVCDVAGSKTCVECTATDHAACVGVEPVCGADQTCHACKAHSECASEVCLPDGSCAAEGDVAYVDGAGTGTACTRGAPCKTITLALALLPAKATVKIRGAVDDRVTLTNRDLFIFADSGAVLTSSNSGTLLTVGGTSKVSVYDLAIKDAAGPGTGFGIVTLPASTGSFSLIRGEVSGCREIGISSNGGTVSVTRSKLTGNQGGAIAVTGGGFRIVNNFIFRNGNQDTSAFGGVSLSFAAAGTNEFAFNTVADNRSQAGATRAGGVICDVPTFNADNNVIARNQNGTSATAATAQTLGACVYRTTRIQNDATGILFKSAEVSPYDYHVLAGSSVIDAAATPSPVGVDIDGDARPLGAGKDQGADEFKP